MQTNLKGRHVDTGEWKITCTGRWTSHSGMTKIKVWQCNLKDAKEVNSIKNNYKTSKVQYHNGTADVRVISSVKPYENAVLVQAGLEEVYKEFIN